MHKPSDSTHPARVYLDHNATTPLSQAIRTRWVELFDLWGNPSSIHTSARPSKQWLRETKQKIAVNLGCSPLEIIFNSGASEGNNSVLKSVWTECGMTRPEFLISQVEHPSVIKTAEHLVTLGAIVKFIPVSRSGELDLDFIRTHISNKTALVSVMYANNETGSIFPIKEIAALAHSHGALMHSDCVQMLGKSNTIFSELNLDYGTFSAHKFYALKGVGFTYVKKSSPWQALIHGGGQERARRGGTENILGITTLGIMFDQLCIADDKIQEMTRLRDLFETLTLAEISEVSVTAAENVRLSNTSNLIIGNVDGETLLMSLDLKGFSVSTGAACSSGNPEPSPVLLAMGLTRNEAQNSLRISIGWQTTEDEIRSFVKTLHAVVNKLRLLNNNPEVKHVSL